MDGDVRVLLADVLEGVEVTGGREALLGPGDVEADHADVAVAHRQLGDLPRARGVAHRGEQAADPDLSPGRRGRRAALPKPLQYGLDHGVEVQPGLDVQL